ncbi:MAG: hypothetical protein II193_02465 [Lachnospiraceae bacterium]|nr:hypothetical protein [Lachnospiraceae bacterium]
MHKLFACKKEKKATLSTRIKTIAIAFAMSVMTLMPTMYTYAAPQEVAQAAIGIDVSKYQGVIDWKQVAASGVQFAMIRVGYRTQSEGILTEDPFARYNLQEAQKAGIKVGVYFFSTAVTAQEAIEEAEWTCNLIDKYNITFPVAYDCEGYLKATSRQYPLDRACRTALAITFLDTVAARGYTPMFYNCKSSMDFNRDWDMSVLASRYKVWVASYPAVTFPMIPCNYAGVHSMWQYTSSGAVAGIMGNVDMNVSYFNYTEVAAPKNNSGATLVTAPSPIVAPVPIAQIQFADVNEVVTTTATDLNLRSVPDASSESTIVGKLKPGDMMFRTGIGNNGWSRVIVNNQIYYVSSQYLTKVF